MRERSRADVCAYGISPCRNTGTAAPTAGTDTGTRVRHARVFARAENSITRGRPPRGQREIELASKRAFSARSDRVRLLRGRRGSNREQPKWRVVTRTLMAETGNSTTAHDTVAPPDRWLRTVIRLLEPACERAMSLMQFASACQRASTDMRQPGTRQSV